MNTVVAPPAASVGALSGFITIPEIARQLGVAYSYAHSLVASGAFGDPVCIGGRYLFDRATAVAEVERRLEKRRARRATTGSERAVVA